MVRLCPHCNVMARFTTEWTGNYSMNGADSFTSFVATCDNCDMPICGVFGLDAEDGEETVWPGVVARKEYPDVPEAIASTASEAHQALGAKAPRAALAVARAVVEATAKDKGITVNGIYKKIEGLYSAGLINEAMKETAHEIRFAGNEAAHGDLTEETSAVDGARAIVGLMDVILEWVYQGPAKVARIRAAREASEKQQKAAGSGN
jgi:hypothetical protein